MLHRCKKFGDILIIAFVGGGESANLKACHFSFEKSLFTYMENWAKRLFVGFWKDGLVGQNVLRSQFFAIFEA